MWDVPLSALYHRYIYVDQIGSIYFNIGEHFHQIRGDYSDQGIEENDVMGKRIFLIYDSFFNFKITFN